MARRVGLGSVPRVGYLCWGMDGVGRTWYEVGGVDDTRGLLAGRFREYSMVQFSSNRFGWFGFRSWLWNGRSWVMVQCHVRSELEWMHMGCG